MATLKVANLADTAVQNHVFGDILRPQIPGEFRVRSCTPKPMGFGLRKSPSARSTRGAPPQRLAQRSARGA
jgi:hypothetical protein